MNQKQRIIIAFFAALTLFLAGLSAAEENGVTQEKTGWQCPQEIRKDGSGQWDYGILEDGTAVITGYFIDGDSLTIPDEVDGIPVTAVARVSQEKINYDQIRNIKKIVLPKSLEILEGQAFASFASLQRITLPQTLVLIGDGVFKNCEALKSITIPEGVTRIGEEAFSGCESLSFPKLPDSLESIGRRGFYNCRSMKAVSIPAAVRTIGDEAFAYSGISKLTMKEGVEEIGAGAFLSHNLTETELPASLRIVGNAAFHPLTNKGLRKIIINGRTTDYGIGVFGYDDGYTRFYRRLQKGLAEGKASDYDAANPENWIDYYASPDSFGQAELSVFCYPGSSADSLYQYHVIKTYLKGGAENIATANAERVFQAGMYTNEDLIYELVIPEGVEEIADYALAGLGTLNKVTLPSTLKRIGNHAFEKCIGLKEVIVQGKTMEEIGEAAFSGCSELKKITVPNGVTVIGNTTFEDCAKLETVTLPKEGIVLIGDRAFANCKALQSFRFNQGLETIGTEAFAGCGIKDVQLPNSVKTIGEKAFYGSQMKNLKLPAEMETIPNRMCAFSRSLSKVTMPKELKRIEEWAFISCPLENIKLPEGLETIGERAFAFDIDEAQEQHARKRTLSKMRSLTLPDSLRKIEKEAFLANDALGTLTIRKQSQLEEIGEGAFSYCSSLRMISLPDSLRKIGSHAFLRCISIQKAVLGNGLTETGDGAFEYCVGLTVLEAPESLVAIGADMLKNHGIKLKVTCTEESTIYRYLQEHYPEVNVVFPKQ